MEVFINNGELFEEFIDKADIDIRELSGLLQTTVSRLKSIKKGDKIDIDMLIKLTKISNNLDALDLIYLLVNNTDKESNYADSLKYVMKQIKEEME